MLPLITFTLKASLSTFVLAQPNPSFSFESRVTHQAALVGTNFHFLSQFNNHYQTTYAVSLRDKARGKELGTVDFSYYKINHSGCISHLHVCREERGHSYGSLLLKYALEKLTDLDCESISLDASPFDLGPGQTPEKILPKLISFYQRYGAKLIFQNKTTAHMVWENKPSNK
jgi:GNAT superfamily N-acetyltransferase